IKQGISNWRNRFATAGIKALDAEYARQKLTTTKEKAALSLALLGNPEDIKSKTCSFLWESFYEDSQVKKLGLFQGHLVACVFLEHLIAIQGIPHNQQVQEQPVGALIYAIQVVHQALLYSHKSGSFKPPTAKGVMEFSKANWADCTLTQPSSKSRSLKRSSIFLKKVKSLKEIQWDNIKEAALKTQEKAHTMLPPPVDDLDATDDLDDDDDELHDLHYDSSDDEGVEDSPTLQVG
ncbi:hypothetical protein H0H81_004966, partial [Sphagnurus paluster]